MIIKIQYTDENERRTIIEANVDKYLIEEHNIQEGNFLIFSDSPRLEERIEKIEQQIQNDNIIKFEVLATIYEEILLGGN